MLIQTPLRNLIKVQVTQLHGETFQDFITSMMYKVYGPVRFTSIREMHDAGCDGIIVHEQCLVACYGPRNATPKAQAAKIKSDYASYTGKWKSTLPNWRLFINLDPSPAHLKQAEALHGDETVVWGQRRFLELVHDLPFGHVRDLCRKLQIDEDAVGRDFVGYILDDLLRQPRISGQVRYGSEAPDLIEKVKLNFPDHAVDSTLQLIELTTDQQIAIADAIGLLSDDDTTTLKVRVLSDFDDAVGSSFEEKFRSLTREYGRKYNQGMDDEVKSYVQALLWHVFVQCLIGKQPPKTAKSN